MSKVEMETKEGLKDVAEAGFSLTPVGRVYTYRGGYAVDGVRDIIDKNPDRTIKNLVDFSSPKVLRKVSAPKQKIKGVDVSDVTNTGISLDDNAEE